jgi:hypothetical protein
LVTINEQSPWRWQLKCLPKHWTTLSIQRSLNQSSSL